MPYDIDGFIDLFDLDNPDELEAYEEALAERDYRVKMNGLKIAREMRKERKKE